MTMTSFASDLYRVMTCAFAAALITLVMSSAFVQSTAAAPGSVAASHALRA
jgi:hypothetical protein